MSAFTALWLKQHATGEKALARDLVTYFASQINDVAEAISDYKSPTTAVVAEIFNESEQHEELLKVVKPHLYQLLQVGAMTEVDRVSGKKLFALWQKKLIIDGQQEFAFATELPDAIVDAIQAFMSDLMQQGYWQAIQSTTATSISDLIAEGLQEGLNGSQMANAIRKALGGTTTKTRARAIARTETTGMMNSGHQLGMQELAEDGLLEGKTWLAISDGDTRADHLALNDTMVAVTEDFDVGGSMAPYPGHASLPPEQRINCRCTVIGNVV